ncbi:MAG: type II toxin-antitoxin system PemK/MazF family toxin [Oscillospiraceae bacterium]|nr:type II toxin-antitoxin system PemK/MazF family toxin [Oscillospiraceae bacterium]
MRLNQGDIIRVNFNPTIGSEQQGKRPAVIISNNFVIQNTCIILVAPVTSKQGNSALNVALDEKTKTAGAVLCAHTRSLDLSKRPYDFIEKLPPEKLKEILDVVVSLVEPSE